MNSPTPPEMTQELVNDVIDLLAYEGMPEVDIQELLMSVGMSIDESSLFRSAPIPPRTNVNWTIFHDPDPSHPPTNQPYLTDSKRRRLRHMR